MMVKPIACSYPAFLILFVADHVTHLREDILLHRINYALTSMEEEKGETYLKKAGRALEK